MSTVEIIKNIFAEEGARKGALAAVTQGCIIVHGQAVALAPVAENFGGRLRNSLMWRTSEEEGGFNESTGNNAEQGDKLDARPKEIEGYGGTNLDYGTYQEFGTRYMIAQPYLRPAGEKLKGSTSQQIAAKFGRDAMSKEFAKRKVTRTVKRA